MIIHGNHLQPAASPIFWVVPVPGPDRPAARQIRPTTAHSRRHFCHTTYVISHNSGQNQFHATQRPRRQALRNCVIVVAGEYLVFALHWTTLFYLPSRIVALAFVVLQILVFDVVCEVFLQNASQCAVQKFNVKGQQDSASLVRLGGRGL